MDFEDIIHNYSRFVSLQVSGMGVGDVKQVSIGSKTKGDFRMTLRHLSKNGEKYKTKTDPKTGELWVARVQ